MDIPTRLRKITQTVRGIGAPPSTIDAVDEITILLARLFDRIAELEKCKCQSPDPSSSPVEIFSAPKATGKHQTPQAKSVSKKSSATKPSTSRKSTGKQSASKKADKTDGPEVSVPKVQKTIRSKSGAGKV